MPTELAILPWVVFAPGLVIAPVRHLIHRRRIRRIFTQRPFDY